MTRRGEQKLARARISAPLRRSTATRRGGRLPALGTLDKPDGGPHCVRVAEVVVAQVLAGQGGQGVLVLVHVVEVVDGVLEGAAGLDGLVGAGLHAETAVHAEAEVDLVAVDAA